jgi:N-acetylmuramoyl-L-alanine amidase
VPPQTFGPPLPLPPGIRVSQIVPVPPRPVLSVVLDPAHGGADAGARGPNGVIESEVVLSFARAIRAELERAGFRVILTRQGNEDPSFDDRSAVINARRDAVFISLHVSSSGPVGTARVYSLPSSVPERGVGGAERRGLVDWDEAQQSHTADSRKLAELLQIQLAQRFRGSPDTPAESAVRQLRTVAAPAIAIEVSSVSVPKAEPLNEMAGGLAQAVARAVTDYRQAREAGTR